MLLVRFRDPEAKRMLSVTVNGKECTESNAAKEWIRIKNRSEHRHEMDAN